MPKVVYNKCYGGYGLSGEAVRKYCAIKGITVFTEVRPWCNIYHLTPPEDRTGDWERDQTFEPYDIPRHDPVLVQVVEELGSAANGSSASLAIDDSNTGLAYRIREHDGYETVEWIGDEWTVAI